MNEKYKVLGRQYMMEFHGCNLHCINDIKFFEQTALKAAKEANATVIHPFFHRFSPQGISGVIIIAESHLAFHTWPEHCFVAADLFTCSDSIEVQKCFEILAHEFEATHSRLSTGIPRGCISHGNHIIDLPMPQNIEDFSVSSSMDWENIYKHKDAWGLTASIDIHDCDPILIRDEHYVKKFAIDLCEHIDMKRYGDTVVVDFGEDEKVSGFSMIQLIETSLISGHFANQSNNAYIDVFSCKFFSPEKTSLFCIEYFKGKDYSLQVSLRK